MRGLMIIFLFLFGSITLNSKAQHFLPITKHEHTKQFYTTFDIGSTVKSPLNLLLDLETNLTWISCHKLKSLTSLHQVGCFSETCFSIPGNGCDGKLCLFRQPNPLGGQNHNVTGRVVQDTASFSTTTTDNGGGRKLLLHDSLRIFTFSCSYGADADLEGLASPVAGVLSLSAGNSSLTKQVASEFSVVPPKFALCLPSYGIGHLYVAGVNYNFPPYDKSISSIPVTSTPLKAGSKDYLITVQSIYVDGKPLSLNPNLLRDGVGAKLSTVVTYTTLHTDIYNALAQSFTLNAKAMGISKVSSVAPFKHCFDSRAAEGKNVPVIEIGLKGMSEEAVKWIFHGGNTVVKVTETVMCLAFYDGGDKPKEMIVIGTHQLQDHMLEFHLSSMLFSFSESLLLHNTSCSTWPSQN